MGYCIVYPSNHNNSVRVVSDKHLKQKNGDAYAECGFSNLHKVCVRLNQRDIPVTRRPSKANKCLKNK